MGRRLEAQNESTFPARTHGCPVVTLSSAGRARISLKHVPGCTKSDDLILPLPLLV